jgi:hypothetical protein
VCGENACLAVLRRSIGTGEMKEYAVLKKELSVPKIIKLSAIVTFNKANGEEEVCIDISLKIKKKCMNTRFVA